jgi:hypothetical protein
METNPGYLDGKRMEPDTNDCCFDWFEDSPTCRSRKKFTCIHGRTLKRAAARRALGLDPLIVYVCGEGHVQHLWNNAGRRISCDKCEEEAVRLTPDEARQAKVKLTFNVHEFYHLSE